MTKQESFETSAEFLSSLCESTAASDAPCGPISANDMLVAAGISTVGGDVVLHSAAVPQNSSDYAVVARIAQLRRLQVRVHIAGGSVFNFVFMAHYCDGRAVLISSHSIL